MTQTVMAQGPAIHAFAARTQGRRGWPAQGAVCQPSARALGLGKWKADRYSTPRRAA